MSNEALCLPKSLFFVVCSYLPRCIYSKPIWNLTSLAPELSHTVQGDFDRAFSSQGYSKQTAQFNGTAVLWDDTQYNQVIGSKILDMFLPKKNCYAQLGHGFRQDSIITRISSNNSHFENVKMIVYDDGDDIFQYSLEKLINKDIVFSVRKWSTCMFVIFKCSDEARFKGYNFEVEYYNI